MAAEILATAGCAVTIYDHMPSLGRKFLMAGRGGLNLTHSEPLDHFISRYGHAANWLAPSLRSFPPEALRAWAAGLGQETFVGSSGRVFPVVMKASPLLRAWLKRLSDLGTIFQPSHRWLGWQNDTLLFQNNVNTPMTTKPDATILALGGASWPKLGSDGNWATILAASGVELAPLRPANCGFTIAWSEHFSSRFAGQPLKPVTLSFAGHSRQGEAMITAQGIEGSAVYALAAPLREAIAAQGNATLLLDLHPHLTHALLVQKLQNPRGSQSFSTFLRKALGFTPVQIGLLRESMTAEQLAHASAEQLAKAIKQLPLHLTGTTGLTRAISTAGGIMQTAVDPTFMLKAKPSVYAIGEMLDWEAPTGGYLLQACFSTATTAAQAILSKN
jgi:uncharacterized flavoprotein (TIGR03862 family)